MRLGSFVVLFVALSALPARGQSLFIEQGYRGGELGIGWSTGPSSDGVEGIFGVSVDGRTDVGLWINRYTVDLGGGNELSFKEYAPFVKFFAIEEENGAPVSLSIDAQIFFADYEEEGDSGRYLQAGPTVYKRFRVNDRLSIYPFAGFKFVSESYEFGGGPAETDRYLTRDFGLHFTTPIDERWFVKATAEERSFRRETYRSVRIAVVGRL
jgi:hypothetical protein